jgi:hypothetical protein
MVIPDIKHTKTVAVLAHDQMHVLANMLPPNTMITCCSERFTLQYDEVKVFDLVTLYGSPLDALAVLMWYRDIDQLILPTFTNSRYRYAVEFTDLVQTLSETGAWEPQQNNSGVLLYTKR